MKSLKTHHLFHFFCGWIVASLISHAGELRTWTDVTGKTMESEFIRVDGEAAVMRRNGNEVRVPLPRLSEADRKHITELAVAPPAAAAPPAAPPAASVTLSGKTIRKGGAYNRLKFDLSEELLKAIPKNPEESKQLHLGLVVPKDFDPSIPQRYLWISSTADYDEMKKLGNIGAMEKFVDYALEQNWVVMATDWEGGVPLSRKHDDVLAREAIRLMSAEWAGFRKSSFAAAGFSRAAREACFKVALMAREGLPVVGLYLDGCSPNAMDEAVGEYRPTRGSLRPVRVYISNAKNDDLSPASRAEALEKSVASCGMRDTRLVLHSGTHALRRAEFRVAMKWFSEPPGETGNPSE